MSWSKVLLAGVVAGIVGNLYDFGIHGFIMAGTYMENPAVFSQEQANPLWFLAISLCLWITVAILFAKTRSVWAEGWKGGATFGFFLGLAIFFSPFYNPLVIADFPYYLAWCWAGINLIGAVVGSAVLGMIYPRA